MKKKRSTALDDATGFVAVCEQGRRLGFDGKTLIHPRQIAAANEVFGVTDAEAARAEVILSAWKQAEQNNQAVTVVEGRLVERLHVDEARRILALRSAISDLSGEQRA